LSTAVAAILRAGLDTLVPGGRELPFLTGAAVVETPLAAYPHTLDRVITACPGPRSQCAGHSFPFPAMGPDARSEQLINHVMGHFVRHGILQMIGEIQGEDLRVVGNVTAAASPPGIGSGAQAPQAETDFGAAEAPAEQGLGELDAFPGAEDDLLPLCRIEGSVRS